MKGIKDKKCLYLLRVVLTVIMLLPFAGAIWICVRSWLLIGDWDWISFHQFPLVSLFRDSFIITVCAVLLQVFTSCFAAYAYSKVDFTGRNFLLLVTVITFAIPGQAFVYAVSMDSFLGNISRLIWNISEYLWPILVQAFSGFGVFLIYQFMNGVPNELVEAARMDGLNEYDILFKVMLPLVKPGIAALVVFSFVNIWNSTLTPLADIGRMRTVAALQEILMSTGSFLPEQYAVSAIFTMIPPAIVFLICQKWFEKEITAGEMKG